MSSTSDLIAVKCRNHNVGAGGCSPPSSALQQNYHHRHFLVYFRALRGEVRVRAREFCSISGVRLSRVFVSVVVCWWCAARSAVPHVCSMNGSPFTGHHRLLATITSLLLLTLLVGSTLTMNSDDYEALPDDLSDHDIAYRCL